MYPKLNFADGTIKGASFHKEPMIETEETGEQEEIFHEGYENETKRKGMLV